MALSLCYLCRSGPTTTIADLHLVCPTVVAVARLLLLEFLDISPRYASWTPTLACLQMLPACYSHIINDLHVAVCICQPTAPACGWQSAGALPPAGGRASLRAYLHLTVSPSCPQLTGALSRKHLHAPLCLTLPEKKHQTSYTVCLCPSVTTTTRPAGVSLATARMTASRATLL